MNCKVKTKQNLKPHGKTSSNEIENTTRDIIYSVDTDRVLNLKEIITDIHGANSEVMTAVKKLDEFLSRPDPTQYAAATELLLLRRLCLALGVRQE